MFKTKIMLAIITGLTYLEAAGSFNLTTDEHSLDR